MFVFTKDVVEKWVYGQANGKTRSLRKI